MRPSSSVVALGFLLMATISVRLPAQVTPPPPPQTPPAGAAQGPPATPPQGRGRGLDTFPAQQRPPADPAVVAKGKASYEIYCRACHGPDLRGGDQGGPNLLRSPVALADVDGESIGPVIKTGRQTPGMPPMPPLPLPDDEIKVIAAFVRSVLASASRQGGPPEGPPVKLNLLVGDASAGQKYFAAKCSSCHAPTNFAGLATKVSDTMQLQNMWVSGGGGGGGRGRGGPAAPSRAVTVAVTLPDGQKAEGRLVRMDDFIVILADADGRQRSFRREGDVPQIQLRDPLEGHKKLLLEYTDKDIHDVTAYLSTLK
jgi:cytochrome c oxidase cbb3-type subunit III